MFRHFCCKYKPRICHNWRPLDGVDIGNTPSGSCPPQSASDYAGKLCAPALAWKGPIVVHELPADGATRLDDQLATSVSGTVKQSVL